MTPSWPAKVRPARLTTLDPQLIREYARLFRIEYLDACDEVFPALASTDGLPGALEDSKHLPLGAREVLTTYYSDDSLDRGGLASYELEINERRVRLAPPEAMAELSRQLPVSWLKRRRHCWTVWAVATRPRIAPQRFERIGFGPGNGASDPQDVARSSFGGAAGSLA